MCSQIQVAFVSFSLASCWSRASAWSRVPANPVDGQRSVPWFAVSFHVIQQLVTKRGTGNLGRRVELTARKGRWVLKDGQPKISQNKKYLTH